LQTADTSIGELLLKRLLVAIAEALKARRDFVEFDKSLRAEIPDEVAEAEKSIAAWEKDKPSAILIVSRSQVFLFFFCCH